MATIKTTGARALLECLRREGVDTIFGYPGGAVIPLYEEVPVAVVPGGEHFFHRKLHILREIVARWIK